MMIVAAMAVMVMPGMTMPSMVVVVVVVMMTTMMVSSRREERTRLAVLTAAHIGAHEQ